MEVETPQSFLTKPVVFTSTVRAVLSNVAFREDELIKLPLVGGRILSAVCKYGIQTVPGYPQTKTEKKTNRGRKPKPENEKKTKKKRPSVFLSCVLFKVLCDKEYTVMVFTNGCIQIPGSVKSDFSDIIDPINIICALFCSVLKTDVHLLEYWPIMQNFKCRVINNCVSLRDTNKVLTHRINYVTQLLTPDVINDMNAASATNTFEIDNFRNKSGFIGAIKPPTDKQAALHVKVSIPIEKKKNKQITLKFFESGKINIDGCPNTEFCVAICEWIESVFREFPELMYETESAKVDSQPKIEPVKTQQTMYMYSFSLSEQPNYIYLPTQIDTSRFGIRYDNDTYRIVDDAPFAQLSEIGVVTTP